MQIRVQKSCVIDAEGGSVRILQADEPRKNLLSDLKVKEFAVEAVKRLPIHALSLTWIISLIGQKQLEDLLSELNLHSHNFQIVQRSSFKIVWF